MLLHYLYKFEPIEKIYVKKTQKKKNKNFRCSSTLKLQHILASEWCFFNLNVKTWNADNNK